VAKEFQVKIRNLFRRHLQNIGAVLDCSPLSSARACVQTLVSRERILILISMLLCSRSVPAPQHPPPGRAAPAGMPPAQLYRGALNPHAPVRPASLVTFVPFWFACTELS
jgi:hypothetical protein